MGRKLVKKPTVGHLWTVSPLPLLDIGMSIGMLGNININVNVRGEHVQTKPEPLFPGPPTRQYEWWNDIRMME